MKIDIESMYLKTPDHFMSFSSIGEFLVEATPSLCPSKTPKFLGTKNRTDFTS